MIDADVLLNLAPSQLVSCRPFRFDGAALEAPLSRFAPADRVILRRLYQEVEGLSLLRKSMGTAPDWEALARHAAVLAKGGLIDEARKLGHATREAGMEGPDTRAIIHDVRGGGLTVLLGVAELLAYAGERESLVRTCVAAARDHAKIMRCLLPDLDPPARAADEAAKAHAIGHFVDKWHGASMQGPAGPVTVSVHCQFHGDVSARCLETAAIDRVVYNLMNNAGRFAADGRAELAVVEVAGNLTRWAVGNRVAAAEAAFLARTDPRSLFAGGLTRGGNGIGLANCAEVVADCFGLPSPADAAAGGYIGAALRGDVFLAWFHWPVCVAPSLPGRENTPGKHE